MEKQRITCSFWDSPLGERFWACVLEDKLVGLTLGEEPAERSREKLRRLTGLPMEVTGEFPRPLQQELEQYLGGVRREFATEYRLLGTAFQLRVWESLGRVPYGSTVTYGQLAQQAGVTGSRAVGAAMAANPICILVPCHRVLPAAGGLGNYSAGQGPATKRMLLRLEGIELGG